jgi:hypothetical protein
MKLCKGRKGHDCVLSKHPQDFSNFYVSARMKDGYSNVCKACEKVRQSERYEANRDSVLERTKAYGKANRHITRKASKNYYAANKLKCNQRKLLWYRDNPDKANYAAAMYRARTRRATPKWLTDEHKAEILAVYAHAKECEMLTGDSYHVDHIIPLKGESVSGLHVPWNLQVLPSDINISKGNRHNGKGTF